MSIRPGVDPSSRVEARPETAANLRRLRLAAGLTQAQVAASMGAPVPQIQTLERGAHSPSVSTVERYATACGATVSLSFAPIWTEAQCEKLNEFQRAGHMHPFTCGGDRGDEAHRVHAKRHRDRDRGLLVATPFGWRCPVCKYTQTWAHGFMFEGAGPNPLAFPSDGALPPRRDPSQAPGMNHSTTPPSGEGG